MPAVCDFLFQHQLHQLFRRRRHILEPLSERHDREAHAFQILHHLHGTPPVEGNLADMETFPQFFDELFNEAVMHHISLGGLEKSLPLPHVIRYMVTPDAQVKIVLRNPEVREDDVLVLLIQRGKHKHECCDVRGGRKVQTAVAHAPLQIILVCGKVALIPQMHWHPPHRLLDPLIQAQLTERVLLRGILFRRFTRRLDLVDTDCDAERRICFLPDLRVRPVVRFLRAVDHRIECRVDLPSFKNVLGFLVGLVTDRFRVCPGSGDQEIQRLHACVAGAFCHDVEQLPVRLCVQLIEHHAVDVEAVLGVRLRGQHLIKAVRG